jgi:signal transduction histidine kinase
MQRNQFIAEASAILAGSIDCLAALQSVAQLAVPDIADGCVVELLQDDGSIATVAFAHNDDRLGQHAAVRPERRRLLQRLGLQADIRMPLVARGRVLGAITLFADNVRAFGQEDVTMAEELARHSAIAVDSARLYEEAQRAMRSRDEMLAMIRHELRIPLAAIMMAAETQVATAPPTPECESVRDAAAVCHRAAQQMSRIISDLSQLVQTEPDTGDADRRSQSDFRYSTRSFMSVALNLRSSTRL